MTRTVTYYPAGGAMRIDGNVYYVLKDRLGSAYATTDTSGNVVGEMRYYAFGETRLSTGTMFTDRLYTGQRQIAELGIYHYNARFYSPKLGRFLSADSILSGMANPQNLNRFSYVGNNPVRYTDPSGHMMCDFCGGEGGSYTPAPPPDDYCATHPWVCGGGGGGTDSGGGDGENPDSTESQQEDSNLLTYNFEHHLLLDSWEGPVEIDPADFEELLAAIRKDVHGRSRWWLFGAAANYDTPFFNGYGLLSGTGCIYGKCYDRSELNYIGEGELWAAVGVSKETGHAIVTAWKRKSCANIGFHGEELCLNPAAYEQPTEEVLEMFDVGYDDYTQHYPPPPSSTSPEPEYILWP